MPFEPIIPAGQRLGNSHTESGAVTGHLFDLETGELAGHASWRWVDEPSLTEPTFGGGGPTTSDDDAVAAAVAILIVVGIIAAAIKAKPALQRWWNRKLLPFASSAWEKLVSRLSRRETPATSQMREIAEGPEHADVIGTVIEAIGAEFTMSSAEWEMRFRAMLAADEILNEQLRILRHARVLDEDATLSEIGRNENLTAHQFAERIKLALKATPISLDDETATALMRTFGTPIALAQAESRRQLE